MLAESQQPLKFFGRRSELLSLKHLLEQEAGNEPTGLCVSGDFGIGRSALLGEFRAMARKHRHNVIDLKLSNLGGVWRNLRISVAGGSVESRALADPLTDMVGVITEASRRGPLLVTADDLCQADEASLRALRKAVEESLRWPVVVAVSVRRVSPPRAPAQLAQLVHGMEKLVLEGLSEQETADLARAVLRHRPPPGFAAWCHRLTLGNPFLLTELLRWAPGADLSARKELTSSNAPVLPAVGEAVADCLNLINPVLPEIASILAVTGENGPDALPLIAKLSGNTLEQTLVAADQLVRLGFIADDGSFSLRHRLVAQALAGGMTAMARSAIHLSTATYLHQRGAAIQRTARQLVASSVWPDDTWPTEVLLEAARSAAQAGDYDTALSLVEHIRRTTKGEHYQQAVLLACDVLFLTDWERGMELALASLRELRDDDTRIRLLNRLDEALHTSRMDPVTTARGLAALHTTLRESGLEPWVRLCRLVSQWGLTDVTSAMEQLGDIVTALSLTDAPAATSPIVRAVNAFQALCSHQAGLDGAETVQQARNALDGLQPASSTFLCAVASALIVLVQNGLHEEAAARAQGLEQGDDLLQPIALVLSEAMIALSRGRVDAARSGLERLLEALPPAETRPDVPLRFLAVGMLAELHVEQGNAEEAWRLLKVHRCAGELGPGWLYLDILLARAGLWALEGDLDGAARDLTDLLRRARTGGVRIGSSLAWRRHGVDRLWQCGLVAEAEDAAMEQLQTAEKAGLPQERGRALRARARVSGSPRAEALLREAISLLQGDEVSAFDLAHAQADWGALLLRLGEGDRAVTALVEAVGIANRCGAKPLARHATALLTAGDPHSVPHTPLRGVLTLTGRERQVLLMATHGMSNRRIAESLEITRRTVELHLSSSYQKLGITGRRDFPELLSLPGVGPMLEVRTEYTFPAHGATESSTVAA